MNLNQYPSVLLGDLFQFSSGLSKSASEFGYGHPFVTFKDVFYNYYLPKHLTQLANTTDVEIEKCSVRRGDVFLTRTSETMDELGTSSVALKDYPNATFNGFTKRLRPKHPDRVVPEYLVYAFRSQSFRKQVTALSTMSTRASLNNEMLARLSIPLPPFETQKRIGQILYAFDQRIDLNRQIAATLEEIARAIFKSWFIDFEPARAKAEGHPSNLPPAIDTLFPEILEESSMGSRPEGWPVSAVTEVIELNPLRSLKKGQPAKYLDMANVSNTGLSVDRTREREFTSGTKFKKGDTLLARITPCLENGKTAYVDFLDDGEIGWGSTEFIVLAPRDPFPYEFGYCLAKDESFRDFAIQSMTGSSGRQRVQIEQIKTFPIINPPKELLLEFGRVSGSLFSQVKHLNHEMEILSQLRNNLLGHLFSDKRSTSR